MYATYARFRLAALPALEIILTLQLRLQQPS
jgi:hypothetical protein